ncbi:MAG: aminotransferase class I/II-fold pyridoxal phosphate-dependent enzyme [Bryobacterales bacterium]|nr:aminotransferase class I/II-fold pyridoxal phosphate-dependent enzyme [Bryobacterales bacterium]
MRIEPFAMERMQSTWENLVDYDMSESGVRPLTLRELAAMGLDLDALLDTPLGYSQSNGTLELREALAALYPSATVDHIEVTNGSSEANYVVALSLLDPGDRVAIQVPNYMQLPGLVRSLGAQLETFRLLPDQGWQPDWDQFHRAVSPGAKLVYLSNPHNPTGSVLSPGAMRRIADRCAEVGAWLLSDEVYQGAEIDSPRTPSFWGMGERIIINSGLSKAYGIPGVRIGWIAAPPALIAQCWSQHDYITIGPNKLSDRIARFAVAHREQCFARTRSILQHNLPIARQWIASFEGFLQWSEPTAAAISLVRYQASIPSTTLAEDIRIRQSTLIVPGAMLGLESHLRIWIGGREDYLREGLRRIGLELNRHRSPG